MKTFLTNTNGECVTQNLTRAILQYLFWEEGKGSQRKIRDREGIKSKELDAFKQKLTAQKLSGLKIPFNKKFQKW